MSTGSGIKYSTPNAVKSYLNDAYGYIQQEGDRLAGLQQALTSSQSDAYRMLGLSPGQDPVQSRMLGTLAGGGQLRKEDYADLLKGGAAPTAVDDPGARPAEYRTVFSGKNWGNNDDKKQQESLQAIRDWEHRNTAYQQYQQAKSQYDAMPADDSAFNLAKMQAETLYSQFEQARGLAGDQLGSERGLLEQLRAAVGEGMQGSPFEGEVAQWQQGGPADFQAARAGAESTLQGFQDQLTKLQNGGWSANPAVTQAIERQKQMLLNKMVQQLGPGYASSSAGIEQLKMFSEGEAAALGDNYRQDIGQAQDLVSAAQGNLSNLWQWGSAAEGAAQSRLGENQRQYLERLQGLLGTYQSSSQGRSQALSNLIGNQQGLLGYQSTLADASNSLASQPHSVPQGATLAQLLQQQAGAYGNQTQAYQKPNVLGNLLSQGLGIAGTAGAAYLGNPAGAFYTQRPAGQ